MAALRSRWPTVVRGSRYYETQSSMNTARKSVVPGSGAPHARIIHTSRSEGVNIDKTCMIGRLLTVS